MGKILLGLMLMVSFGFSKENAELKLVNEIYSAYKSCKAESRHPKFADVSKCFKYINLSEKYLNLYKNGAIYNAIRNDVVNQGYRVAYFLCVKQKDLDCMETLVKGSNKYGLKGKFYPSDLMDLALDKISFRDGKVIRNK